MESGVRSECGIGMRLEIEIKRMFQITEQSAPSLRRHVLCFHSASSFSSKCRSAHEHIISHCSSCHLQSVCSDFCPYFRSIRTTLRSIRLSAPRIRPISTRIRVNRMWIHCFLSFIRYQFDLVPTDNLEDYIPFAFGPCSAENIRSRFCMKQSTL